TREPTVAAIVARVVPGADVELLTATVRQWKHLAALTQAEQEEILVASVVDLARRQIGLFLGILLSVTAVVIALIIYTMTMEKLKPIATLKLIGAPDRTIVGLIVQQALILGASGWAAGLMLILTVKDYFPRRVVLEPFNVMVLGGIVFVVCIAASGLAVRAAMKVDPATALGS
ncbi:MAG: ABC transporter permease, partial [Gemmobacter sp.]